MERSAFPLNHLYIMMGPNICANKPGINFKMKMLVLSNKGKYPLIALVSNR
jgi:hypothetical protein